MLLGGSNLIQELKSGKSRAGILTLYHGNYNLGGLLQAYALPKVLKEHFGIETEQIDYIPAASMSEKKTKKKEKKNLFEYCHQRIYQMGIIFFRTVCKQHLRQRKQVFECFMKEIPHSEVTYTFDSVQKSLTQYQVFVCGGDQIWNPILVDKNIEVYTLQFVPSGIKKIAYAPSIAVSETTLNFERVMRNGLNALDAISIREKKSVSILQSLTDKKIDVVVDPVLLMTENEWTNVASKLEKKENYILCYLLGDRVEYRAAVKRFTRNMHLPVLTFPHIYYNVVRKCDLFFGDIRDYTSGPREFLGLIKNAEFVITDSFHACVFSMIFQKPFVVFERNKVGEKGNMNSRIYDFLEEYHLENQLITAEELEKMNEIPKIDFTYAYKHWKKRREESLQYLENALKDTQNGE